MNRQLGMYILLLNFFLFLIGGLWVYSLNLKINWLSAPSVLDVAIKFLCPIVSTLFVLLTLKSIPSPIPDEENCMIDDLPPAEHFLLRPISGGVKLLGVIASLLSIYFLLEFCYSLYILSNLNLFGATNNPIQRLSIFFVVYLFNAICQPWYVWRTFRNVKR
jgi:hypothetical protein